jgi:hypothetical protein
MLAIYQPHDLYVHAVHGSCGQVTRPLRHPSPGRSGLRVNALCLGAMIFVEQFAFGSNVATSEQILAR